jgi:catechol 2,3-dioxygenase-like lactoylglutathione lyase family enzyme
VLDSADFWATVPVLDMERAKRFYRESPGLEPVKETEQWASYRCGSSVFQLYPTSAAGTAQHTLGGFVVDDIAATVKALRERGVVFNDYESLSPVEGIADLGGVELAAWFNDSEGNILAISQFLVDPLD